MQNMWDERFSAKEYVYGEAPNVFFAEQLDKLIPGIIILPCEGEGRNAVYPASRGWQVKAFDSSEAGKSKALQLAHKKGVHIEYTIINAADAQYPEASADVVAFVFAHFPPAIRKSVHQKALSWLRPGGKIILQAFNPLQLQNNSGGPKDITMLYTIEMLKEDFAGLNIELLYTGRIKLDEGKYHQGMADIISFTGIKNI
jgi:SAM-dependent methyltransferase